MLAIEGGGDMLILFTGVGGALSALGRDIPVKRKSKLAGNLHSPTFQTELALGKYNHFNRFPISVMREKKMWHQSAS